MRRSKTYASVTKKLQSALITNAIHEVERMN